MAHPRIGSNATQLAVQARRTRQTPRNQTAFDTIWQSSKQLLSAGARSASSVIGLPTLTAALSGGGSAGGSQSPTAALQGELKSGVNDELQLIELQRQIQQFDRQIALLSNVLRARHDTAKTAISNLRP